MRLPALSITGVIRTGRVLALVGVVGFVGLLGIDLVLAPVVPSRVLEDKMRLATSPRLVSQPKVPAFLELTDGAVPAYIRNFDHLESEAVRHRLLSLEPGTEVTVLRPMEASAWLTPLDILALRIGSEEILETDATVAAQEGRSRGSRAVALYVALAGVVLLTIGKLTRERQNAA